jgi:tRNA (cmo5U34)-methyltransferase
MQPEQLQAVFDQQASSYDQRSDKMAPVRDALHFLAAAVLMDLPADARILCVGAGTGAEIIYLARRFPGWRFTAVEPAAAMLEVFRLRAEEHGITSRCTLHNGYLDSLPVTEGFHAATSLLVSQFILQRDARVEYFNTIANRLLPDGYLINADLCADTASPAYSSLLEVWLRMTASSVVSNDAVERMRAVYERDVAVLPPEKVSAIMAAGGFTAPVEFFQGVLIHAWYARPF